MFFVKPNAFKMAWNTLLMRFALHSNSIETVKEGLQIQEFWHELFFVEPFNIWNFKFNTKFDFNKN